MNVIPPEKVTALHFEDQILEQGDLISKKLHLLSVQRFPPNAKKTLRPFTLSEVATYLGISQSTLKKLHLEGKGPLPQTSPSGRRSYTADQMMELRQYLDQHGRSEVKNYVRTVGGTKNSRLSLSSILRADRARQRQQHT